MRVVVFAEGVFETLHTLETEEEARSFVCGVETGSSFYGGIGCASAYIMPEDLGRMKLIEDAAQVKRALLRMTGEESEEDTSNLRRSPDILCPRCQGYHRDDM